MTNFINLFFKGFFLKKIAFILLMVTFFQCIVQIIEKGPPFFLLVGPVLFYAQSSLHSKQKSKTTYALIHLIPFALFTMGYYFFRAPLFKSEGTAIPYNTLLSLGTVISLSLYAGIFWAQRKKWQVPFGQSVVILLGQVYIINVVIASTVLLLLIGKFYTLSFDVSPHAIILMLLVLQVVFISRYLYLEWRWEFPVQPNTQESSPSTTRFTLPESLLDDYENRLRTCMLEKRLYLRPDVSIDSLAQETSIPKHHLSSLLNARIGKSFYQLIATYRINEAVSLLQQEDNSITIEALAYECGFNTKSSFNKYFKKIVGCLPSEFREKQAAG